MRRNIRKRRVSYLSIIIIALLAVNAYLGISYAARAMLNGANDYYKAQAFEDLQVISTKLMSESALETIRGVEGVADVEGMLIVNARVGNEKEQKDIEVRSLTERINIPYLVSGRLPEKENECAIEQKLAAELGLHEGDTIVPEDSVEGLVSLMLEQKSFTVTGIVTCPDHISEEISFSPYVIVLRSAFNAAIVRDDVMRAVIRAEGAPYDRYDSRYFDVVKPVSERIASLSGELSGKRSEEIRQLLDDNYSELSALVLSYRANPEAYSQYTQLMSFITASEVSSPSGLSLLDKQGNIDKIMETIGESRFVILNNKANTGYVFTEQSADGVKRLSSTFSLLFIFVGALVIYSTVGRMVDDDSKLVGATKALGLYNREIFNKYLAYGISATMIGTILGIFIAYFGMQKVLLILYKEFFVIRHFRKVFIPGETILIFIGSILVATVSVWLSCSNLLKSSAVTLMAGSVPKHNRKRTRKKSSKSLYFRLILMNMLSDAKRVIVTIVSITGCCALLMVGFTLKFAISKISPLQFGDIQHFDSEISFDFTAGVASEDSGGQSESSVEDSLCEILEEKKMDYLPAFFTDLPFLCGDEMYAGMLICTDAGPIDDYYTLREIGTGNVLSIPSEGILVTKMFSEFYGIKPGDTITLFDSTMNSCEAVVSGVFNNYIDHLFFCSRDYFKSIFGIEPIDNHIFVKSGGADLSELRESLMSAEGFLSIAPADAKREEFERYSFLMNFLIVILGVMAALMAYFILLNLANSYIAGKKRELTIMRINGFSEKETVRYASLEMIVTTAAGVLLGLVSGALLGYRIILLLEKPFLQYYRVPDLRSFLFSACITVFLSWLINSFALRQVKDLKLSDI